MENSIGKSFTKKGKARTTTLPRADTGTKKPRIRLTAADRAANQQIYETIKATKLSVRQAKEVDRFVKRWEICRSLLREQKFDLTLICVDSDGDCLYDSVAFFEYQCGDRSGSEVKKLAIEELKNFPDLYRLKAELEYTDTYDEEVEYLSGEKVHATSTVLHAVATVIQKPLHVYAADTDPELDGAGLSRQIYIHQIEPSKGERKTWGPPIYLFNHVRVHYDRLVETSLIVSEEWLQQVQQLGRKAVRHAV